MDEKIRKIPTTVFTGFLGSGKTTIISHLIDYLILKNIKVAYVKNEIGDVNIDGQIIRGKNIQTRELLSGCICCTLTGPFFYAINELVDTVKPDRILIEASGIADPATVALMISSHPKVYRDGVIAIIDVINFEGYKNLSLTARSQAELTDLIVFNKIELADLSRKKSVVGYIRELNDVTPIVEAPNGILDPRLAFGLDIQELDKKLAQENLSKHEHHLENDNIETFSQNIEQKINIAKLNNFLDQLPNNVLRVKGFINSGDNESIIINKVGKRSDIQKSLNQNISFKNNLVFIGFGIENLKAQINIDLHKCIDN
jgi:G3E family GTPase